VCSSRDRVKNVTDFHRAAERGGVAGAPYIKTLALDAKAAKQRCRSEAARILEIIFRGRKRNILHVRFIVQHAARSLYERLGWGEGRRLRRS